LPGVSLVAPTPSTGCGYRQTLNVEHYEVMQVLNGFLVNRFIMNQFTP